jgi:hypothetical protein
LAWWPKESRRVQESASRMRRDMSVRVSDEYMETPSKP